MLYNIRACPLKTYICTTFRPANFVFPIPAAEINAGFMKDQNTGWEDGLPERN